MIPVIEVTNTFAVSVFVDNEVILYEAPTPLFNDNGPSSSLSSSQPPVDSYNPDISRRPPIMPWQFQFSVGREEQGVCRAPPPSRGQNSDQLRSVSSATKELLQGTSALFDENDSIHSRVVLSTATSCCVGYDIFDTDLYVSPTRAQLISRAMLPKLVMLRARTDQTLENSRTRYKRYFDNLARVTPTFRPGKFIIVNRLSDQLSPDAHVRHEPHSKLLWKSINSFG